MEPTLVVGLGSSHGDDQAGWKVIEQLGPTPWANTQTLTLSDPSRLWEHLLGRQRLILIDASQGMEPPGSIRRFCWPEADVVQRRGSSSHALGLGAVLQLAELTGRLPDEVVVYAVEATSCRPGEALSPPVVAALPRLCQQVMSELSREDANAD